MCGSLCGAGPRFTARADLARHLATFSTATFSQPPHPQARQVPGGSTDAIMQSVVNSSEGAVAMHVSHSCLRTLLTRQPKPARSPR